MWEEEGDVEGSYHLFVSLIHFLQFLCHYHPCVVWRITQHSTLPLFEMGLFMKHSHDTMAARIAALAPRKRTKEPLTRRRHLRGCDTKAGSSAT